MTVKRSSFLQYPVEIYELSEADRERFAGEERLGMVSPQHPVLRQVAQPVAHNKIKTSRIQQIVTRLFDTASGQRATKAKGKRRMLVGLAAPQIGELYQIIVMDPHIDPERKQPGKLECFINPEIVWQSRETEEGREGCFSAGPVWGLVRRPVAVKIRAFNKEGERVERIFEGFGARIVQHEIDHLSGIRFPERIKSDHKRHWVFTDELEVYPKHIKHWPRTCTMERWKAYSSQERGMYGS